PVSSRPSSTLFPYTTLFRSAFLAHQARPTRHLPDQFRQQDAGGGGTRRRGRTPELRLRRRQGRIHHRQLREELRLRPHRTAHRLDRKSTRLNSSHVKISYAV